MCFGTTAAAPIAPPNSLPAPPDQSGQTDALQPGQQQTTTNNAPASGTVPQPALSPAAPATTGLTVASPSGGSM